MSSNDPNQPNDPSVPGQPYNPYGGFSSPPPSNPNPYGQNPNPYGQPDPGQGDPYGQPQQFGYPPQGGYAPVQPPAERPRTLKLAFWFIMAAGVVSAFCAWLFERTDFVANVIRSEWSVFESEFRTQLESDPNMAGNAEVQRLLENPDEFINTVSSMMTGLVVVSTIVSLVLYFLVGFFVGRGVNAMRIIATILAAFSVLGLLTTVPAIALYTDAGAATLPMLAYVLSVLLGVAGVVMAWLRPSNQYVAQRRAARRAGYR